MRKIINLFLIVLLCFLFVECPENSSSGGGGGGGGGGNKSTSMPPWPKRLGGKTDDYGYSIKINSNDFVLIIGNITGNADLNGDGDSIDSGGESASGYGIEDIFITNFTTAGKYSWSKRLGGPFDDYGRSITTDTGGNIIVAGNVNGNADLNGDGIITAVLPETTSATYGGTDIFITKFFGIGLPNFIKRLGGTGTDCGNSVITDSGGNIVVTGFILGNADLNGDGDSTDGGAESVTAIYGLGDIFITKFNSSGTYQWSKRLGGVNYDEGYGITADSNGNIIVTGIINGNADLNGDGDSTDGGAESSTGYGGLDIFIAKFNSSGTYQWSKRLGGTSTDRGYGITTDSNGNVIVTGPISGNADLNGDGDSTDGGAESSTVIYGSSDIFITKFNSSGTYQWSKRLGGVSTDEGYGITTDSNGNVIVTGYVNGNTDLNGDGDSIDGDAESSTGFGNTDIFITKFNSSGTYQWSKRLGGINSEQGMSVSTDSTDNIIITGSIEGNTDMNGDGSISKGLPETSTSTFGDYDIFISKFNSNGLPL